MAVMALQAPPQPLAHLHLVSSNSLPRVNNPAVSNRVARAVSPVVRVASPVADRLAVPFERPRTSAICSLETMSKYLAIAMTKGKLLRPRYTSRARVLVLAKVCRRNY